MDLQGSLLCGYGWEDLASCEPRAIGTAEAGPSPLLKAEEVDMQIRGMTGD